VNGSRQQTELEYRDALASYHAATERLRAAKAAMSVFVEADRREKTERVMVEHASAVEAILAGASHETVRAILGLRSRPDFDVILRRFACWVTGGRDYHYGEGEEYGDLSRRIGAEALVLYRQRLAVRAAPASPPPSHSCKGY